MPWLRLKNVRIPPVTVLQRKEKSIAALIASMPAIFQIFPVPAVIRAADVNRPLLPQLEPARELSGVTVPCPPVLYKFGWDLTDIQFPIFNVRPSGKPKKVMVLSDEN